RRRQADGEDHRGVRRPLGVPGGAPGLRGAGKLRHLRSRAARLPNPNKKGRQPKLPSPYVPGCPGPGIPRTHNPAESGPGGLGLELDLDADEVATAENVERRGVGTRVDVRAVEPRLLVGDVVDAGPERDPFGQVVAPREI